MVFFALAKNDEGGKTCSVMLRPDKELFFARQVEVFTPVLGWRRYCFRSLDYYDPFVKAKRRLARRHPFVAQRRGRFGAIARRTCRLGSIPSQSTVPVPGLLLFSERSAISTFYRCESILILSQSV